MWGLTMKINEIINPNNIDHITCYYKESKTFFYVKYLINDIFDITDNLYQMKLINKHKGKYINKKIYKTMISPFGYNINKDLWYPVKRLSGFLFSKDEHKIKIIMKEIT